jgi:hypothetical protein
MIGMKNRLLAVAVLGVIMEGGMPVLQDEYVLQTLVLEEISFSNLFYIKFCKIQGQECCTLRENAHSNCWR